jgi:integrase-like protein
MWHQLRHTYASVLAAGGIKRYEVEQLMGHRSQGTTGLYTHPFRESYSGVEAVLGDADGGWVSGREDTRRVGGQRSADRGIPDDVRAHRF